MIADALNNVYFGEEGQPVFHRESQDSILLDTLTKKPWVA